MQIKDYLEYKNPKYRYRRIIFDEKIHHSVCVYLDGVILIDSGMIEQDITLNTLELIVKLGKQFIRENKDNE